MSKYSKIIYGALFLVLLLEPHFINGHILFIPQAMAQSVATLVIGGIAAIVYLLHRYDVRKKELERRKAEEELGISVEKFNDAIEYIGLVNRRLPLLKNLTTDLLSRAESGEPARQAVFHELLRTAVVSITQAEWGMFRFIEMKKQRTVGEFFFNGTSNRAGNIRVSNRALVATRTSQTPFSKVANHYVVPTAHRDALVQCHYVFPPGKSEIEQQFAVLQSIVDQAQLFYSYLYKK